MEFRKVAYNNNTSVSSVMGHEWGTANSTNLKLVSQKKKKEEKSSKRIYFGSNDAGLKLGTHSRVLVLFPNSSPAFCNQDSGE